MEPNPTISKSRQVMTSLGVLKRQYGRGRGQHLRVDPDTAEALGRTLIEIAEEARKEQDV